MSEIKVGEVVAILATESEEWIIVTDVNGVVHAYKPEQLVPVRRGGSHDAFAGTETRTR